MADAPWPVADARWARALREVWQRLPEHDCGVLRALVAGVRVDDALLAMGNAGTPEMAAGVLRWWVTLAPARWVGCDGAGAGDATGAAARRAVVAHELAHVLLRHGETVGAGVLNAGWYTAADVGHLVAATEMAAWVQAVRWLGGREDVDALRVRRPGVNLPPWLAAA